MSDLLEDERLCARCSTPKPLSVYADRSRPGGAVDHDHVTGVVRALLCTRCNRVLGMVAESEDRLMAIIEYPRRHA